MLFTASRVVVALTALILISACSARFPSPKRTVWAYTKDNGLVHEGMTRRQVYAVAQPVHPPRAYPPTLSSIRGIAFFWYHREIHEFSAGRVMEILYRRASTAEYRSVPLYPKHWDDLLNPYFQPPRSVRSEENPRDVVHRVSAIPRKEEPLQKLGVMIDDSEVSGMYDHVFINPPVKRQR